MWAASWVWERIHTSTSAATMTAAAAINGHGGVIQTARRQAADDGKMRSPSQIRERFEAKVQRAKHGALLVAGLHLLSRFFGLCALTWATVVLLGGFASALRTLDFLLVSALLLLEGSRLFIVQTFTKLLSRSLFRESHRPEHFSFQDRQSSKALHLDLLAQSMSSVFASASFISCVVRFSLIPSHSLSDNGSSPTTNLTYSLFIFYILVSANSFLAILSALLRPFLRRRCDGNPSVDNPTSQNSLLCFHDEVFRTAMHVGFPEADQLDILEFAYTKLSSDYKRNIRPPLIKAQNKDLICYLYHNQQGIAMNCGYLVHSEDVWKQVVATNLPGFWAGEQRIELQVALFWALRERMYGAGKDAESALNSIESLGQAWADLEETKPYPFLVNDPATGKNIVDALVLLLLQPIRPTLLFQLRAFEACCRNRQVLRHLFGGRSAEEAQELCQQLQAMVAEAGGSRPELGLLHDLCPKLLKNVTGTGIWMTTRIYAASALLSLICYGTGEVGEARDRLIGLVEEFINPAEVGGGAGGKRPYFWLNDMMLVEKMRRTLDMESYGRRWEQVRMMGPDGAELPAHKVLALVADT